MDFVIEDDDDGRPFSYSAPSSSAVRNNTSDPYDFQIEDDDSTANSFLPSSALADLGAATKKTGFGKQQGSKQGNKRDVGGGLAGRGVRSQLSAKAEDILSKYKARSRTLPDQVSHAASAPSLDDSTSVDVSDSFGSPSPRKSLLQRKQAASKVAETAYTRTVNTASHATKAIEAPDVVSPKSSGITSSTVFGRVMNFSDLAGITSNSGSAVVEDDSEGSIISEHVGDHRVNSDFAASRRPDVKHAFIPGQHITAAYRNGSEWFAGKVLAANSDGSYAVEYDDGDEEDGVLASNIRLRIPSVNEEQSRFANSDSPSLGRSTSVYSMRYDEDEEMQGQSLKPSAVSRLIASSIAESVDGANDANFRSSARRAGGIEAVEESTTNDEYSNDFELTTHGSVSQLPTATHAANRDQTHIRAAREQPQPYERIIVARKPASLSGCRDACVQTDENVPAPSAGLPASSFPQIPPSPYFPGYWPPMSAYAHPAFLPSGGPFPPQVGPFGPVGMPPSGAPSYGYPGYGLAQTFSSIPSAYGPSSLAGSVYLQAFADSLNRIETQQQPLAASLPSSRRSSDSVPPLRETSNAWGGSGMPATATTSSSPAYPPKAPWQSASSTFQLPISPALSQHPSVMKALSKYQAAIAASDVAFEKQLQQIRENLSRSRAMYTSGPPVGAPQAGNASTSSPYYTQTLSETRAYIQSVRESKPAMSMQAARERVQEEARRAGGRIEVFPV